MARVLVNDVWFEQVEPNSFSEKEFEDRVLAHAPAIYPNYHVIPFKRTVTSSDGSSAPDLVFISKSYSEWHVVELEMGYHPISHVDPQVGIHANAFYGQKDADYLVRKTNDLDAVQTQRLVTTVQPRPLVIVNEFMPTWITQLQKYQAIVATFELFRSDNGDEIFLVDGEYTNQVVKHVTICEPHPLITSYLRVHNPNNLAQSTPRFIKLRYNNCITDWKIVTIEGETYITPNGRNFLAPKKTYEIVMRQDLTLMLRMKIS